MKKKISIIGGGTAGIFLASFINTQIFDVTIYEKQKTLGRKFLVAGDGGFNLTHSEPIDKLKSRYLPKYFLDDSLSFFTNINFKDWLEKIGIPTFIGSSKRVFPENGIKPITVLKTIESHLKARNVNFNFGKEFTSWSEDNNLIFNNNEIISSDINVFALGGGSWSVTGSDGHWLDIFAKKGIKTSPFKASNCAFQILWSNEFIKPYEGQPLKNISISINGNTQKGEVVITKFGLEGNAIYALSPYIQKDLALNNEAKITIDFKPTLSSEVIHKKINESTLNTTQTLKSKLKLTSAQIFIIKQSLTKDEFINQQTLVENIKNFPLKIKSAAPIDEAISTSGGINLDEINQSFELKNFKNNYCIGEMLDWDAPTGGYLIQACASISALLAQKLNDQNLLK